MGVGAGWNGLATRAQRAHPISKDTMIISINFSPEFEKMGSPFPSSDLSVTLP